MEVEDSKSKPLQQKQLLYTVSLSETNNPSTGSGGSTIPERSNSPARSGGFTTPERSNSPARSGGFTTPVEVTTPTEPPVLNSPVVNRIFTDSAFERHRENIPQPRVDQAAASQSTVDSQSVAVGEPNRNEPTHGVEHYIQRMHASARAWNARYNAGLHNLPFEGPGRDPSSVADLDRAQAPLLGLNPSGHYLRSIYRDGDDVPLPPLPSELNNSVIDQPRNDGNSNGSGSNDNNSNGSGSNDNNSNGSNSNGDNSNGSNSDNVANNNASA